MRVQIKNVHELLQFFEDNPQLSEKSLTRLLFATLKVYYIGSIREPEFKTRILDFVDKYPTTANRPIFVNLHISVTN
jgi:hypothetical protein